MVKEAETPLTTLVASFTSTLDAELARTLLDQHDISSRPEGDILAGAALPLQTAFGGVRVMVAADNAERASKLIGAHEKALAAERRRTDTADERVARLPPSADRYDAAASRRSPDLLGQHRAYTLVGAEHRHYLIGISFDLLVIGAAVYWLVNRSGEQTATIRDSSALLRLGWARVGDHTSALLDAAHQRETIRDAATR